MQPHRVPGPAAAPAPPRTCGPGPTAYLRPRPHHVPSFVGYLCVFCKIFWGLMPKKLKSTFTLFFNRLWKLIDQANHRNLNSIKKILSSSAFLAYFLRKKSLSLHKPGADRNRHTLKRPSKVFIMPFIRPVWAGLFVVSVHLPSWLELCLGAGFAERPQYRHLI